MTCRRNGGLYFPGPAHYNRAHDESQGPVDQSRGNRPRLALVSPASSLMIREAGHPEGGNHEPRRHQES